MVAYFRKTQPNNPVMVAGRSLRFDLLRTEHHELIVGLRLMAKRGVGGVQEIDEATFTAETLKKKNSPPSLIRHQGREEFVQMPSPTRRRPSEAVVPAAEDNQAQPGHVTLVLPTIGRISDL